MKKRVLSKLWFVTAERKHGLRARPRHDESDYRSGSPLADSGIDLTSQHKMSTTATGRRTREQAVRSHRSDPNSTAADHFAILAPVLLLLCALSVLSFPHARHIASNLVKSSFSILLSAVIVFSFAVVSGALVLAGLSVLSPRLRSTIRSFLARSGLYRINANVLFLGLDNAGGWHA